MVPTFALSVARPQGVSPALGGGPTCTCAHSTRAHSYSPTCSITPMQPRIDNLRRSFLTEAKKWDRKAQESTTEALREYYKGRADGARQAASSLAKFTFDKSDNPYKAES